MTIPSLPLEITEMIIDILAHEDPILSSTKTCALVCHEFHHICRKHIFGSIALNNRYAAPFDTSAGTVPQTKATNLVLHRLLKIHPEVGALIRNLDYCIENEDLDDAFLVSQTFPKISRLKSLILMRRGIDMRKFQWNDNPLRPVLLSLLQVPTLTHLRLFSIDDFVPMDLAPCVNLEHFEYSHLSLSDSDNRRTNSPKTPIQLRSISVGISSPAATAKMCTIHCADGTHFINFNRLTNLSIRIYHPSDIEASRTLFSRCKQLIIVYVNLRIDFTQAGLFKMLQPSIQRLKCLHVVTLYHDQEESDDPFSGLTFELEKMTGNNVVEALTIDVSIQGNSRCKRGDEWGRLDAVLTHIGWPKLHRVSLKIIIWKFNHEGADELQQALENLPETQFPKLSSSKAPLFQFAIHTNVV